MEYVMTLLHVYKIDFQTCLRLNKETLFNGLNVSFRYVEKSILNGRDVKLEFLYKYFNYKFLYMNKCKLKATPITKLRLLKVRRSSVINQVVSVCLPFTL